MKMTIMIEECFDYVPSNSDLDFPSKEDRNYSLKAVVVWNSWYGILRGQMHSNLSPEHTIMYLKSTEIKKARCVGKHVYTLRLPNYNRFHRDSWFFGHRSFVFFWTHVASNLTFHTKIAKSFPKVVYQARCWDCDNFYDGKQSGDFNW